MVFGLFMPMLDNLVVNVALPTIQRTLGAQVSGLQWIIEAYTLTFASFMLTGGSLGDLYGRKRFFMGGLALFTLGSLACGLSGSIEQLIAFRAVQGLGAALLLPGSLSIITATFHGKERGAAIGIWAAMSGLAVAIGPLVGGYLVEHFSWESIFFINIPVGIAGFLLTAVVVKESRDLTRARKVDLAGLITGTAGLFFLVYALIQGNPRGWTDRLITGSFGLAALLLIAFLIIETKKTSPMLPLSFFRNPTFAASNVVAASVFFALFGTVFFLALYLQDVRGFSPFATGLRMLPFTAAILLISPIAGKLSDKYGSRGLMALGTALAAGGLGLMLRTQIDSSYLTVILPSFIVLGSGMAMTMAPMTAAVMASVEARHAGVASAATNTTRELGGVFGIALLGTVVTSAFKTRFMDNLVGGGLPRQVARSIVSKAANNAAAGGGSVSSFQKQAPPGTPIELVQKIALSAQQAFVHGMHIALRYSIGFMILASLVAAIFVRTHVAEDSERRDLPDGEPEPADDPAPHGSLPGRESIGADATPTAADPMALSASPQDTNRRPEASSAPLATLMSDLPFSAGTGSIQRNLEEVALATMLHFRSIASAAGRVSWRSAEEGARFKSGSRAYGDSETDISIWPIVGYLRLEQRFGRISRKASPEQAATLLVSALAARAMGLEVASNGNDLDGVSHSRQFVKSAVKTLLEGISAPDEKVEEGVGKTSQGSMNAI